MGALFHRKGEHMTAAAPERHRTPTTQAAWLLVYWVAVAINLFLLLEATVFAGPTPLPQLTALVLALIAALIGALFATKIMRRGVSTTVFVRATTTVRVIAVAWSVLAIAIVSGVLVSVVTQLETEEINWWSSFAGTVGSISLLAVLGPGYKEFREAIAPE